jgi:hypothetical protein
MFNLSFIGHENQAAIPVILVRFWCNCGANRVEKVEIMDLMDDRELTPSREKTEITPINAVFKLPIGFEVRRLS